MIKTMSEDVRTFSTMRQLILRTLFLLTIFDPKWARAQEGQGPSGPGPKWPRAQVGPGPKWARAQVAQGPSTAQAGPESGPRPKLTRASGPGPRWAGPNLFASVSGALNFYFSKGN